MNSWKQSNDEYESIKSSLSKTLTRLRYLCYFLVLFLLILAGLFIALILKTSGQLVDISVVLLLGMILIGLISTAYILFKGLLILEPVKTKKKFGQ